MDLPPTPPTPYREGKPLAEIIPPDRRTQKTVAIIVSSMVTGVALWVVGGFALDALRADHVPPIRVVPNVPGYVAGRVPVATLRGPGGTVELPPRTRSVVHVWLQGCQDCMPAFEAMGELSAHGGLGVGAPVINVAYGEADPVWARRYGVGTNLVFDQGGASIVRPLGIGTFTTLVVDPDGSIVHRDRPDRPGYKQRVRTALNVPEDDGDEAPTDDPDTSLGAVELNAASVERVVAAHRAGLKRQCWESLPTPRPKQVSVKVAVTVDPKGRVAATSSSGDDAGIQRCLEHNIRTWVFPAPATDTRLSLPFRFEAQ